MASQQLRVGRTWRTAAALAAAMALFLANSALPDTPVTPPVFSDPLNITNPYHPFVPSRIKLFKIKQGHTDAYVINCYDTATRTFMLNGVAVQAAKLVEIDVEDGVLVEISCNFFAQADDGTVWYFGETVDIYDDTGTTVVSNEGSWLVGGPVMGDPPTTATATEPAVFMPPNPRVGETFKPEDLFPIVDETVEVLKTGKRVVVPGGKFRNAIVVEESTLLSEDTTLKWYAPGVGVVQEKEPGEILRLIDLVDLPPGADIAEACLELLEELTEE